MHTIYIELLDEGIDVWRPVAAALIEEDWDRISGKKSDSSEQWAFQTGDVVRCETRQLSGGLVLVAVEVRNPSIQRTRCRYRAAPEGRVIARGQW